VLGVPLNYFFCEDDLSAELSCLIDRLNHEQKQDLILLLRSYQDHSTA
ncbi:XRE family transcriptional regulator, partial [Vibrio anguillarum]|nr:XRE family transcriptional regulator [Vibrio anguillarum]